MDHLYGRVIRFVNSQPWALTTDALITMRELLSFRAGGGRLTHDEIQARIGSKARRARERRYDPGTDEFYEEQYDGEGRYVGWCSASGSRLAPGSGTIAVLGVIGMISQRASSVDDLSGPGGTSIERLTAKFRSALSDASVKGIVFDHDSPGGSVYGVQELAEEIRGARGQKPIEAVANSLMASASYWLGSAADRVSVTPSGEAGSIGVYAAHVDVSKQQEMTGEKVTLVNYGENKVLGNPFEPLSTEARDDMQKRVDEYGQAFERAVAKQRGVPVEQVRKNFGQGLVFGAKEAVERGLADQVATLDDVVRRVGGRKPADNSAAAAQLEHDAARSRAKAL